MGGVTIPEDVKRLAEEAYDHSDMHLGPNQTKAAVKAIARAILAERQRCADLAEKHIFPWSIAAGEELASAILSGEK